MSDKKHLSERVAELLEAQLTPAVVHSLRRQGEMLMRRALEHAKAENLDRYTALLNAYIQQLRVLAVWKALAEHAEQGGGGGDGGRMDERIVRILEMFNIKITPPPPPETFKLAPPQDETPF